MELFIKGTAVILIAVILILALEKQSKEIALLISVLVCCIVVAAGMRFLDPVMEFIRKLQAVSKLNEDMLGILLKIVGVGLISEIMMMVCADSGNASLGKALQTMGAAVALWLSLPLLTSLMELVEKILGGV